MDIFSNNTLNLQLFAYAGILLFFWLLELLFLGQKFSKKFMHTVLNGKFLFFVLPVQVLLSMAVFFVAYWTELED